MKRTIFYFLLLCAISSCAQEPDHAYRQAIRDYLSERGYANYQELEWGKVDSVHSYYNAKLSHDYFVNLIEFDIQLWQNDMRWADAAEKRELQDSIRNAKNKIREYDRELMAKIADTKKNRIGLSFKFKIPGQTNPAPFTFVFNNDGETIGHVMNMYGDIVEIPQMIPN